MRQNIVRVSSLAFGLALIVIAVAGPVYAGPPVAVAPEIDGSTILAGIGLVGAGAFMLRARRRASK